MKKFYLPVLATIGLLCTALSSAAQLTQYRTVPSGTFPADIVPYDLANPKYWLVTAPYNGQPPDGTPCTDCRIIIDCNCLIGATFTMPVVINSSADFSEVDIRANAVLTINQYVILDNVKVIIGNDPTTPASLIVNDEVDLLNSSFIQLANNNTFIDASNVVNNPIHGPIAGNPSISGLAGILEVTNTGTFPAVGSYDYLVSLGGYGNPAFAPSDPPGTPGSKFLDPYFINCSSVPPPIPPLCQSGVVYGPAVSGFDNAVGIWSFAQSTPLPVELVQLVASRNDDGSVKVFWATSQEENASHFEVQRSGEAGVWESIGTVQAKGFSSITTNYSYTDLYPLSSASYYRLKMVDLDGKFKYSKIVSVSSDTKGESLVIYNNPFTDMIRLKVNINTPDNLTLTVTDILGKTYLNQSFKARSGDNFININPGGAPGLYILHIQGRGYDKIVKLVRE